MGKRGFPPLVVGGMGFNVLGPSQVNEISRLGAAGTLSAAGLRNLIVSAVQNGDEKVIAMAKTFPFQKHIDELMLFAPDGKWHKKAVPMDQVGPKGESARMLTTISVYVAVKIAKEGHSGVVLLNIMWKLADIVLPTIYGAMLADIDGLVFGAGVAMEAPDIVNKIRAGQFVYYDKLYSTNCQVSLEVHKGTAEFLAKFERPLLIPILSNFAFCNLLLREWNARYGYGPDFFILEDYRAGGHNAPPRNHIEHIEEKDGINTYFEKVLGLGVPIIVAGGLEHGGTRADLLYCQEKKAFGMQVGSRFALSKESNILQRLKDRIIRNNRRGRTRIITNYRSSPTGYPLKEIRLSGTLARKSVLNKRRRSCKYGQLRQGNEKDTVKRSCPAMPSAMYRRLNPDKTLAQCRADCRGKVCLCEALLAAVGMLRSAAPPLVTMGESGRLVMKEETIREIMEEILTPQYVARMEIELKIDS